MRLVVSISGGDALPTKLRVPVPEGATVAEFMALVNERIESRGMQITAFRTQEDAEVLPEDVVADVFDSGETVIGVLPGASSSSSDRPMTAPLPQQAQDCPMPAAMPAATPAPPVAAQQADGGWPVLVLAYAQVKSVSVTANPRADTIETLRARVAAAIGVRPAEHFVYLFDARFPLHVSREDRGKTLAEWGLTSAKDLLLCAVVKPKFDSPHDGDESHGSTAVTRPRSQFFFSHAAWQPSVKQSPKAMSHFLATLYTLLSHLMGNPQLHGKLLGHFRRLCGFHPAVLALRHLIERRTLTHDLQAAFVEACFAIARTITPPRVVDSELFQHAAQLWAFLLSQHKPSDIDTEVFQSLEIQDVADPVRVRAATGATLSSEVFDRAALLAKIAAGEAVVVNGVAQSVTADMVVPDTLYALQMRGNPFNQSSCTMVWSPRAVPALSAGEFTGAGAASHNGIGYRFDELEQVVAEYSCLQVVGALGLKSGHAPLLTWTKTGNLGVFTSRLKGVGADCEVLDPASAQIVNVDPNELAVHTKSFATSLTVLDSRPTEEATIVLFDVSQSMVVAWNPALRDWARPASFASGDQVEVLFNNEWFFGIVVDPGSGTSYRVMTPDDMSTYTVEKDNMRKACSMSRLDASKRLMDAFSNRSKAYDLPHNIGLTLFGAEVKEAAPLTRVFNDFETHVQEATANGTTSLYDALAHASVALAAFARDNPNAKLRILCLTDGEDTSSKLDALPVVQKIQEHGIFVDAVLIGGTNNKTLRGIVTATGGFCFCPSTIAEAVRIFELETMLAVRQRRPEDCRPTAKVPSLRTLEGYGNTRNYPYTTMPRRSQPEQLARPNSAPRKALTRLAAQPPPLDPTVPIPSQKHVLRSLSQYLKDPHPFVSVYPCVDDIRFWKLLLVGPEGTPYHNGVFLLYAEFGSSYPLKPPTVRFVTPIYHCNVNSDGKICHSVFDRNWTSETSFRVVVDCIYGLLLAPEPNDPLDSALAEEYFADSAAFEVKARDMTRAKASKSKEQWEAELESDSAAPEIPPEFICPISQELMSNPVSTPHGHSYDRENIVAWLQRNSTDPSTRLPLKVEQLFPNIALRKAIERWREAQLSPWWQTD